MRFRKGRIAMLLLGAAIIWLGGTVVVRRVLLSKYTYAMERVDPITGTSQRIFQPGEEAVEWHTSPLVRAMDFQFGAQRQQHGRRIDPVVAVAEIATDGGSTANARVRNPGIGLNEGGHLFV